MCTLARARSSPPRPPHKTPPPRGGRRRLFFALALATNTRRTCAHAAACPPWHGFRALALDSPASERAAAWTCAHLRDACHARVRAGAAVIAWRRVGGRAVRASVAWAGVLGISRSRHRRCGSQAEQKEETRAKSVEGIGVERQWWVNARWQCVASAASDEDGGRKREFEMRCSDLQLRSQWKEKNGKETKWIFSQCR
ncbi:hypothetical protein C8J57DRAFT_1231089 [Mycena rebaudengoi]|nr:hypothetical protein C8J57DRAFT_1231089 [Mycena rebaudengoi]